MVKAGVNAASPFMQPRQAAGESERMSHRDGVAGWMA
jgi:hypothetical protein